MIFVSYLILLLPAVFALLLVFLAVQVYQMGKIRDSINKIRGSINDLKKEVQGLKAESQKSKSSPENVMDKENVMDDVTVVQIPVAPDETKSAKPDENESAKQEESPSSIKQEVLKAITKRREIEEEDLPGVIEELSSHFSKYPSGHWAEDLSDHSYCRFLDLRNEPSTRVVVIGDIHCDYYSLAAILLKLSVAQYDYFGKAYFVFLGDYLDRGSCLFEPLLLLKDLKEILGERMVMLKGNHESITYDAEKKTLKAKVRPNDSCKCLNEYCGKSPEFLKAFSDFYCQLPTYVYLKTPGKNVLLTHASIPRDIFLNSFRFDEENGRIRFESTVPETDRLAQRKAILKDMIWGDPKDYDEKIQVEGRFEFGRKQFEKFYHHHHISLILRSHEEAALGYKAFFGNRVYTVFSTGGEKNAQTGYPEAEPAFAVIQGDNLMIENSFLYQCLEGGNRLAVNLFTNQRYYGKDAGGFLLSEEFLCSPEAREGLKNIFKEIRNSFPSDPDVATE